MAATKKPAPRRAAKFADPQARDPQDPEVTDKRATEPKSAPVVAAGPVAVHVDSGDIKVVVAPPSRDGFDRRLYRVLNDLPPTRHTPPLRSGLPGRGPGSTGEPLRWPTRWRRRSACPGSTSACTFPATPRWAE